MSLDPQNESAGEEQWMVAIAPGNVQMMDVEQLDAAYQAGQINDSTMVWTQGMDAWLPLSQVIGGEDEAAPEQEVAASAEVPVQAAAPAQLAQQPVAAQQSVQPAAAIQQQVDATTRAWQQQADVASAAAFGAAHGLSSPNTGANFAPVTASGFPPVVQPAFRAPATGAGPLPQSAFPPAAAPKGAPVPSTVPVAMNLDSLDLESLEMPKKKSKLGLFAAAALVLGAGAFTAINLGGPSASEKPAAAAAAGAVDPGSKPLTANDPNAPLNLGTGYTVTEAEKKAFAKEAEKDQELRDKMAQALTGPNGEKADTSGKGAPATASKTGGGAKAKASGGGSAKKSSGGGGVSKGGSSFDPLNGDI